MQIHAPSKPGLCREVRVSSITRVLEGACVCLYDYIPTINVFINYQSQFSMMRLQKGRHLGPTGRASITSHLNLLDQAAMAVEEVGTGQD